MMKQIFFILFAVVAICSLNASPLTVESLGNQPVLLSIPVVRYDAERSEYVVGIDGESIGSFDVRSAISFLVKEIKNSNRRYLYLPESRVYVGVEFTGFDNGMPVYTTSTVRNVRTCYWETDKGSYFIPIDMKTHRKVVAQRYAYRQDCFGRLISSSLKLNGYLYDPNDREGLMANEGVKDLDWRERLEYVPEDKRQQLINAYLAKFFDQLSSEKKKVRYHNKEYRAVRSKVDGSMLLCASNGTEREFLLITPRGEEVNPFTFERIKVDDSLVNGLEQPQGLPEQYLVFTAVSDFVNEGNFEQFVQNTIQAHRAWNACRKKSSIGRGGQEKLDAVTIARGEHEGKLLCYSVARGFEIVNPEGGEPVKVAPAQLPSLLENVRPVDGGIQGYGLSDYRKRMLEEILKTSQGIARALTSDGSTVEGKLFTNPQTGKKYLVEGEWCHTLYSLDDAGLAIRVKGAEPADVKRLVSAPSIHNWKKLAGGGALSALGIAALVNAAAKIRQRGKLKQQLRALKAELPSLRRRSLPAEYWDLQRKIKGKARSSFLFASGGLASTLIGLYLMRKGWNTGVYTYF